MISLINAFDIASLVSFIAIATDFYPNLLKNSEYFILVLDEALKLSIDVEVLLAESCIST